MCTVDTKISVPEKVELKPGLSVTLATTRNYSCAGTQNHMERPNETLLIPVKRRRSCRRSIWIQIGGKFVVLADMLLRRVVAIARLSVVGMIQERV
jgi:hypothetical protein